MDEHEVLHPIIPEQTNNFHFVSTTGLRRQPSCTVSDETVASHEVLHPIIPEQTNNFHFVSTTGLRRQPWCTARGGTIAVQACTVPTRNDKSLATAPSNNENVRRPVPAQIDIPRPIFPKSTNNFHSVCTAGLRSLPSCTESDQLSGSTCSHVGHA